MAPRRGRGAELNALRKKKQEEKTGVKTKPQSSVSQNTNRNGGGRTGGITRQQVAQKVRNAPGYTSSGKAKRPASSTRSTTRNQSTAQSKQANPYATKRNIVNRTNSSTAQTNTHRGRINGSGSYRGRAQQIAEQKKKDNPVAATAREMIAQRKAEKDEQARSRMSRPVTAMEMRQKRAKGLADRSNDDRVTETIRNTGKASEKGFLDSVSGHAQTALDALSELTSDEKRNYTWLRAAELSAGIDNKAETRKAAKGAVRTSEDLDKERRRLNTRQEQRQAEWDKRTKNASGFQKALYGAAESGTGMLTDIGIGAATGTGQSGALAAMFSRTYGTTRGQAEREGATENEDRLYAGLQAVKEVGTELMFPGVGLAKGYAGKGGIKAGEKLANALTKNLRGRTADVTRAGLRLLGGTAEENAEEIAGWGLDPFIKDMAYGRNVRKRAKDSLLSDLPQLTSREDAERLNARLNSGGYVEELAAEFEQNGLPKKKARELAEKMRDLYSAYYAGDTDAVDRLGDDIAGELTGQKKVSLESFNRSELLETLASTTLLTAATGLPGAVTTAQRGSQIKNDLGADGLKALAKEALNSEDEETSERGRIAQTALESGRDITSTQAYDLEQGLYKQQEKDVKRQDAQLDTAGTQIKRNNYVTPIAVDNYGRVVHMEKATRTAYNEAASNAETTLRSKESLTDAEVNHGAVAIAGFKTGAFTIDDANTIVANEEVKEAFEEETGIDLTQYEVRNRDGSINIPKTNAAIKDALFAMASDNLVKTAEVETANWMDETRGETVAQITARMGAKGGIAVQLALDDIDERDAMQYRVMAAASDYVYQSARNIGLSWDEAKDTITSQFSTIPEAKLQMLYEAGLADREIANDKMLGLQTKVGEAMSENEGKVDPTKGQVLVETKETPKGSVIQVFSDIADSLGVNIHLVDELPNNANGQYYKDEIWINVNSRFEENLGYVFMHEVTHHLKKYAPEQYQALEDLVRERWFNANPDQMQNAIAEKIKLYDKVTKGKQQLTEAEALEEIIADSAHEFLNDRNFAKQVADSNPSLAKAVLDAIREMIHRLRQIFSSGKYENSRTHMDAVFSQLGIMDEAEKLWLTAYTEAVKNKAAVGLVEWQDNAFDTLRDSISPQQDADYMDAVNRGDMETAQRMVDEAAAESMPNTKLKGRWYHGTENEFTEFNFSQGGKNGHADGYGIYLTNDPEVAGSYGTRMIEGYVNVERPASALDTATLTNDELHRLIARTVNEEAERLLDDGYDSLEEAKFDTWISNYTDTRYAGDIDKAIDEVIDNITNINGNDYDIVLEIMTGMGIRDYDDATKFYEILTDETGIDGFETKWGDETEMADPNTPTIALAFRSNQIKDASPVTYDDNGNVIPLSERFNAENNDIRYSLPTQDSDGNILTDGQMDYFKNSQARDLEGKMQVVYHTTNHGGFTVFDPSYSDDKRSLFFASNFDVSQTYGRNANRPIEFLSDDEQQLADEFPFIAGDEIETKQRRQRGYYSCYLNLENPLVVDAQGASWNRIPYGSVEENPVRKETLNRMESQAEYVINSVTTEWEDFDDDFKYGDYSGDYRTLKLVINGSRRNDVGGLEAWTENKTFTADEENWAGENGEYTSPNEKLSYDLVHYWEDLGLSMDYYEEVMNTIDSMDGSIDYEAVTHNQEWAPDYITSDGHKMYYPEIFDEVNEELDMDYAPYEGIHAGTYKTRQLAKLAQDSGNDGVIIRNCYDIGALSHLKNGASALSDIYIAFSSNQVKDTRNENPSENPDIRYSITPEDDVMEWLATQWDLEDVPLEDQQAEEGRIRLAKSKKEFIKSKNLLWNERWLTEGKVLDKSAEKHVRNLIKGAMANSSIDKQYRQKLVDKTFITAKSAYWLMKDGRHSEAATAIYDAAKYIVENADYIEDTQFNMYKDLRDYLRNTPFKLGEEYWSDTDFGAFRRRNMGRIKLVKGETNIDELYQDLQDKWPEWFNEDEAEQMTPPDQLLQIQHVLDTIQPYRVAYSSEEAAELIDEVANELYDIVYEGKEYKSIADTYKEKYDAKTKAMKLRHEEAIRKVKENSEKKVAREKQKFKEYKEKKKQGKEKAKHFGHIQDNIDWLTNRLVKETKDKNIPEGFRRSLAHMLMQFDMQTKRSKKLEAKYGPAKKTLKIRELRRRLEDISKEDESGEFAYNEYLFYLMDALADKVEGKTADALDVDDLIVIDTMLKSIRHEFSSYNKVWREGKQEEIASFGEKTIEVMDKRIAKYGKRKVKGVVDRLLNEGEETPIYFFGRLDPNNEGIGAMYQELSRGEDKHIRNMDFLRKRFQAICGEYFNKKKPGSVLESWRDDSQAQTFNLKNGAVTLNPAQIMSLYCLSKREQAMGHILGAGIVASPVTTGSKLKNTFKGKDEQVQSVMITYDEIQTIIATLTKKQMEMADELQSLMNNEMAAWGNETSLKMHGIKLFREHDYFPIKSSNEVLSKTADQIEVTEKIKNFGFTKPLVRNANNAIMIDDIFSVTADHCNKMSLYNAFAIPISDFMRVYNYKHRDEDGSVTTVQQAIGEAFTRKANDYIMKFIGDVNGNTKTKAGDAVEALMNKTLANYKKAAIGANPRVALQQPTAIFRAFMEVDPKYFAGVVPKPAAVKEMREHCPKALWKSWGHYDVDMGRDMEDIMMNNDWSRMDTVTMGIYGGLDDITWGVIWQAVKKEVKAKNPSLKEGTPEYWEAVNTRAKEVFDKTQVVDSIFNRSDTMRSKSTLTKMMVSFMAEPTLTYNVLRNSLVNANEMRKDGDFAGMTKSLLKMTFVLGLNAAAVSAAAAVWDAVRGKGDDDDDKEWGEVWLMNFFENFKDNANPVKLLPVIKDIWDMVESKLTGSYRSQNNMAMEAFETFATGLGQMKKKLTEGSDKSWYDISMNVLGGLGYLFGFPVKTVMRDVKALSKKIGLSVFAADGTEEEKESFLAELDVNIPGVNLPGVKDGSKFDNALNKVGLNLTPAEKQQRQMQSKAEEFAKKHSDLSGEDRDKAVWKDVTKYMKESGEEKSFSDLVAEGNYTEVRKYRRLYEEAGGDLEYFDGRMLDESKKALKKSIDFNTTDEQYYAQQRMLHYLETHGMTQEQISSEIVYKSDVARDMKVAMRIGDMELMQEAAKPLAEAGLMYPDLERLWDNRNRVDLVKYKQNKGRYADKLKSMGTFIWPTKGVVTSHFGYRDAPTAGASSNHPAIDIGASTGTPVVAADGGVIISAGSNGGYGNSVGIKHDNGMVTWYNHLYSWNVKVGDTVAQGQQIAQVGSTGISTGPHLDFKILDKNGKPVDPEKYLS